MRARALINKIEGNLLIQESLVRLDFKDATLDEIVKSLSKQAGFEVGLALNGTPPTGTSSGPGASRSSSPNRSPSGRPSTGFARPVSSPVNIKSSLCGVRACHSRVWSCHTCRIP